MTANRPSPNEAPIANSNGVRTALAFHGRDLAALSDRLERIERQLADIGAAIAAHNASCVAPARLEAVEERLEARLRLVEAWQSRTAGGGQYLWLAAGLLVTLGALVLAGKGKWW